VVTTTSAREAVARVVDPEIRVLTLEDLGVVRDVREAGGRVTVTITPTYSG
jgi:ring-1,2-phenylacetyl-CoA epoxidase subunit PaaD